MGETAVSEINLVELGDARDLVTERKMMRAELRLG